MSPPSETPPETTIHVDAHGTAGAPGDQETGQAREGGVDALRAATGLRDRIANALSEWTLTLASGRPDAILLPPDAAALRDNSAARADAVMAVVQPYLDGLVAEFGRQIENTAGDAMEHTLCPLRQHGLIRRAEQAEAANARVRAVHPREIWAVNLEPICGSCLTEHELPMPWPCPSIAALGPAEVLTALNDPQEQK